jgi:hypothetical protein
MRPVNINVLNGNATMSTTTERIIKACELAEREPTGDNVYDAGIYYEEGKVMAELLERADFIFKDMLPHDHHLQMDWLADFEKFQKGEG